MYQSGSRGTSEASFQDRLILLSILLPACHVPVCSLGNIVGFQHSGYGEHLASVSRAVLLLALTYWIPGALKQGAVLFILYPWVLTMTSKAGVGLDELVLLRSE